MLLGTLFGAGCSGEIRAVAPATSGAGSGAGATAQGGGAGPTGGTSAAGAATNGGGSGGSGAATAAGGSGAAGGSSGTGSGGSLTPDDIDANCASLNGALSAGLTRLRRLTRDQFNSTLADLIQATGTPADRLNPDERIGPFNSNAISPVDNTIVQQHAEAATELALAARARMSAIAQCDLESGGTACATRFVTEFGERAFRRPLESAEIERYLALYSLGSRDSTAADGFRLVLEGMLQSPSFLYHTDLGGTPSSAPVPLGPYELASRLSYFLWNSLPDSELFALAANGTLATEAVLASEVERLLADDRAGKTIGLFHRQWLGLDDLPQKARDTALFPAWGPELGAAMLAETALFSDYVVRRGDGLLGTLFTSNLAFPSGDLFEVYGVSPPAGYVPGTPISLDATQRAGLLTQAAFLADNAHNDQTSPVHRGILVRENVLCQPIQDPPPGANTNPPPVSEATTTRERFAQHEADPTCGGCHVLMDPIGLGFEHYDPIGAWRTNDGLSAVDATGSLEEVAPDLAGDFDGAVELANKLAGSREVRTCVGLQWFRFSLGRMESVDDSCSVKAIRDGFEASGGNVRELMVRIALSDAFRHARTAE
ncbi:MAG TPA: DUF1592 domain-containing protein [Polyangiaceae bacterium]